MGVFVAVRRRNLFIPEQHPQERRNEFVQPPRRCQNQLPHGSPPECNCVRGFSLTCAGIVHKPNIPGTWENCGAHWYASANRRNRSVASIPRFPWICFGESSATSDSNPNEAPGLLNLFGCFLDFRLAMRAAIIRVRFPRKDERKKISALQKRFNFTPARHAISK